MVELPSEQEVSRSVLRCFPGQELWELFTNRSAWGYGNHYLRNCKPALAETIVTPMDGSFPGFFKIEASVRYYCTPPDSVYVHGNRPRGFANPPWQKRLSLPWKQASVAFKKRAVVLSYSTLCRISLRRCGYNTDP